MDSKLSQDEIDRQFMLEALSEARKARKKDEVPVGAIIVKNGKIIARGHNTRETKQNALNHSEIIAIKKACKRLRSWRLVDCDIYVTLEPCFMCAGAIVNSRLSRVVFGAYDSKAGCCGSIYNLVQDAQFNHRVTELKGGVLNDECAKILTDFFASKRTKKEKK